MSLPVWERFLAFRETTSCPNVQSHRSLLRIQPLEEEKKFDLAMVGSVVAPAPPKTLAMLLNGFFKQPAARKISA
jgi:hypothetical protein